MGEETIGEDDESGVGSDGRLMSGQLLKNKKKGSPYADLYSLEDLKEAVAREEMKYTINLNVCKCIDNQKHMLEPNPTDVSLFVRTCLPQLYVPLILTQKILYRR